MFDKEEIEAARQELDNAVKKAKAREIERGSDARKLAKLRQDYPDLADLVADESLTLAEATAAAKQRDREEVDLRDLMAEAIETSLRSIASFANDDFMERLDERMADPETRADIFKRIHGGEAAVKARRDDLIKGSKRLAGLLAKLKG